MKQVKLSANPSRMRALFFSLTVLALCLTVRPAHTAIPKTITVRNFFGDMTFDRPLLFRQFPGMDSVYLVLQQSGGIVVVRRENNAWVKAAFDSLHVTGLNGIINPRGPDEGNPAGMTDDGGLVGFAFHPDYATNRKYYVYYVDPAYPGGTVHPGTIVLAERTADTTLLRASGEPQRVLLSLAKPYVWHNGGTLRFGPEGYLYTAIGDGGSGGDPQNRAQNKGVLFGKFLRINVDGADAFPADTTRNYAVPADNPFVDSAAYLPEIWAYGLRSPWKWSFHPVTGEIWMGDIGQGNYEEITRVPRGANLGWRIREGAFCYPTGSNCQSAGLTPPVFTFPSRSYGYSVTGGVFFTGDTTGAFHGLYLFGDYGSDRIWAMQESGGTPVDTALVATVTSVTSIDKDSHGRVFASSIRAGNWSNTGVVYILESPDMILADPSRIAGQRRTPPIRLSLREFLAHRERYVATSLDGKRLDRIPAGAFLVREKGANKPPALMVMVR